MKIWSNLNGEFQVTLVYRAKKPVPGSRFVLSLDRPSQSRAWKLASEERTLQNTALRVWEFTFYCLAAKTVELKKQQSESQMGFQSTTLCDLVGCFNH